MVSEVKKMLEETGYPVAYNHFTKKVKPPYIAFRTPFTNNMKADNKVYVPLSHYDVELCTVKKDPVVEKRLTDALDNHGIAWEKTSEEFIQDDGVFSIIYEFEQI